MFAKALSIAALGCTVPMSGFALGIRLFDHDAFATARGDAFVATADNPSAIYYNPAGITQLKGQQVRGALNLLNVEAGFESSSLRDLMTQNDFTPLPGAFYTYSPEDFPLSFGVGYYRPFGLALKWPDSASFRTTILEADLQYHTLNPVVAWQVTKTLSIAAGPTLNYAFTDLRKGITAPGDEFKFKGDDFAYGVTAGLLWQPAPKHSFGISYRSATKFDLQGESRIKPFPGPKQDASMRLPFPQVIIGGYSYRPTPDWNLEVDLDWTDWDGVNTPTLKQKTGNVAMPLNWKNSFGVEAGATRYFDNGLHVSGGYVYIENSVPTKSFTPLLPDQDMHVFSTGVGGLGLGKLKKLSWDLTYQFTFGTGRDVSSSVYGPSVAGHYTLIAHAFSLSLGYRF